MQFLPTYLISVLLLVSPVALSAAENLDERLFSELRLINQSMSKLASENEAFIEELDRRERCSGATSTEASCREESLQHLTNLDESNRKTEEHVKNMIEGYARIYGLLRVAHMQCDLKSINFDAVPASLRAQSQSIKLDPDAVVLKYIEASEDALEEDLDELDCEEIESFTATIRQISIAARRAQGRMR
ncbi:hypothetical protein KUV78_12295 [Marinobacter hydrocarbonoclasticus]|jgi:hypothetical protein|uniref:hypothetical protein n=1 Tax=Marinobacter nauticus TaxID=2743 RepID=UPI001C938410|nr:hypothetical protein [Marinobacter nauticus]MBY6194572.1 hypothetical protein [Marinobacter nauticus]MBY6215720.1 hypothetical protein [Marinobacter nauticus]